MNFHELLSKMNELDQPLGEEPNEGNLFTGNLAKARAAGQDQADLDGDGDMEKVHETEIETDECGMPGMANMPSGMMGMRSNPPQADSINANVSLNASGPGGIKDLMNILRNIEGGHNHGGEMEPPAPFGDVDKAVMVKKLPGFDSMMNAETFANEPDEMYGDMDSAIRDGGDLNRSKRSFARAQPGDNPMAVESIKNKLSALYEEIKNR